MISALHLIWMLPTCAMCGFLAGAFISGATISTKEYEAYQQGIEDGRNMKNNEIAVPTTVEELFVNHFNSNFNEFQEACGGMIYGVDKNDQLYMVFIDTPECLHNLYECSIIALNEEGSYKRAIIKAGTI